MKDLETKIIHQASDKKAHDELEMNQQIAKIPLYGSKSILRELKSPRCSGAWKEALEAEAKKRQLEGYKKGDQLPLE